MDTVDTWSTQRELPLVVTADVDLADDVRRLAAAAGTGVAVTADLDDALRGWASASVVLVGVDLAAALGRTLPPRRPRVHVVGTTALPDDVFRVALALGAESVAELPTSTDWLTELLTDAGDGSGEPGLTVGVVGGAGGVGASVFASALALCAAETGPSALVDADLMGAGVDRVLGLDARAGVRWDAMMAATGRLSARALREALPVHQDLSVLAFGPKRPATLPAFAVREVLSAARRGFAQVVLDLPRRAEPIIDETLSRCDQILLVTTLTVPAVTATARLAARLPHPVPTSLVVRGGPGGVPAHEVSRLVGVPLLVSMGDQRGLDEALNLGAGPLRSRRGALARAARQCLAALHEGRAAA
jgi:secretion/DNA translocation related CpaE-like protein